MSLNERVGPSQRVISEGSQEFRFFACVPQSDFSPLYVLAKILGEKGLAVKISQRGKDIDGQDTPEYLAADVQIWLSDKARQVAELVKKSQRFQVYSQLPQPADNFVELVEGLAMPEALQNRMIARAFWHRLGYVEEQLKTVRSPLVLPRYREEQVRFTNKIKEYGSQLLSIREFATLVAAEASDAATKIVQSPKEPVVL